MTPSPIGRAFVFGDQIDTDLLAPGHRMKLEPDALAAHCLEAVDPTFASAVRPGDFVVAGLNFGLGSSREQAAVSLKRLGVRAVIARSFARIFWRNAINLGLPAVTLAEADQITAGDRLSLDLEAGRLTNETQGRSYAFAPFPDHLTAMMRDGGLIAHLKRSAQPETGAAA
ncbi:3-isopropylmalate dehydratase [Brevundimonas aurifodinae]|uniref:3-isopropylmalate dehydratase small subunit n=2 Tax=Brevundimonas TaxID=41275 RepID=A0ABV1NRI0_9CAUL|nr:MAG: 3-isopropylmalate dehydratase [Brevundimonas sp. 12-68-7]OYX33697.1 MAG: 3-isopropylmalate dehydratase [Brevundimonas subvibrioides]